MSSKDIDRDKVYSYVSEDYQHIAEWYDHTFDAASEFANQIKDFESSLNVGQNLLDIGAGTGKEAAVFAHNFDVTALDLSEQMLTVLKQRHPDIKTVQGSMLSLPFDDSTFDAIWSARAIIHIKVEDLIQAFQEFHRVLKEGGLLGLIFLVPPTEDQTHVEEFLDEPEHPDLVYYRNLYSSSLIKEKLRTVGFKVVKEEACFDSDNEPLVYCLLKKD